MENNRIRTSWKQNKKNKSNKNNKIKEIIREGLKELKTKNKQKN